MDQFMTPHTSPATRRRAARLAKGYSLDDLAVATGLTVNEITTAEEKDCVEAVLVRRIERALS